MRKEPIKLIIGLILLAGLVVFGLLIPKIQQKIQMQPRDYQRKENFVFEEKQLTNFGVRGGISNFSWSPDGKKILFELSKDGHIWIMDSDGSNQKQLTKEGKVNASASYSPDGEKVVYVRVEEYNTNYIPNIWIMDSNGENQKRLTSKEKIDTAPSWSPDGKKIAYISRKFFPLNMKEPAPDEIWIMNNDGSNKKQLIGDQKGKRNLSWSPDGTKLLYEATAENITHLEMYDPPHELWVIDSDGTNQKKLVEIEEGAVEKSSWSPDGKRIIYESYVAGIDGSTSNICVIDNDGNNKKCLTNGSPDIWYHYPSWSPDGEKIIFHVSEQHKSSLWMMDIDGENQRQLTKNKTKSFNSSWSPDGDKIVFSREGEIWIIKIKIK